MSSAYFVAGLVNFSSDMTMRAYAKGSVMVSGDFVGGLVGFNLDIITTAYFTGSVVSGMPMERVPLERVPMPCRCA